MKDTSNDYRRTDPVGRMILVCMGVALAIILIFLFSTHQL